ncbi:MAG: DUF4199 domain-containing protein [Candidatus Eisenbacteria bacterium]
MKSAVQAGVILGLLVLVWTLLHGWTGWYKDEGMSWTFWMVIPFEVILLVWMLKNTRKQGFAYGKQVTAGIVMSLVAGAVIFVGSYAIMTLVFPTYFKDIADMSARVLTAKGMAPEQVQAAMAAQAPMMAPLPSACMSFLGTVVTGLVVSLIAAVLIRHKPAAAA